MFFLIEAFPKQLGLMFELALLQFTYSGGNQNLLSLLNLKLDEICQKFNQEVVARWNFWKTAICLFIFRLFSIAEQMCIVEANSVECCFRFLNFLLCNEVDYGVWIAPETLFIQVSVKLTINPACPSKLY